jgi:hypothetical protein
MHGISKEIMNGMKTRTSRARFLHRTCSACGRIVSTPCFVPGHHSAFQSALNICMALCELSAPLRFNFMCETPSFSYKIFHGLYITLLLRDIGGYQKSQIPLLKIRISDTSNRCILLPSGGYPRLSEQDIAET